MVLFVLLNLNVLALKIVQRDTHAGQIIDALCSYHEPTRRCLDRALTRWGNRPGPCGNGSSMRSWVRVALSGGVLPAFLPVAGLPCPPSSFSWARDATGEDGKAVHLAKWARPPSGEPRNAAYSLVGQLSAWREAPGRLFRPPSTVQPCAIFAAFRGDRASSGRLHAFEFELREDNA